MNKFALIPLCLLLAGCDLGVDTQMQAELQQYFPLVELSHPQPNILLVDTHVANITEKFAAQTVATILSSHCCHGGGLQGLTNKDLDAILPIAGYKRLAISFEGDIGCVYDPPETRGFVCGTNGQYHPYLIHDQNNIFLPTFLPGLLQPRRR